MKPALSRTESSLRFSLLVNLVYFAYKSIAAIALASAWLGASAFYYLVLSIARLHLLHSLRSNLRSRRTIRRKYRFCGWILMLLTIAIGAIGGHSILRGEFIRYPGHMIYAAATYTFYSLTVAIVQLYRLRGMRNPLHTASKILSLACALTAIFSLQCAMIARFGSGAQFQSIMNTVTGIGVFIAVAGMSLYMILEK